MRYLQLATLLLAAAPSAAQSPHVVAQIPAGDGGWDLLSVDPVAQRVYVARPDGVTAIDLKSGKATDHLVAVQRGHAALVIPGTHDVLATSGESNTAVLFDGLTGKVRATIPTGTKPDAAAYDPATKTVWVMNPGSGDMTVIDPVSAKVLATVPVGGSLELAVADGQGRLYANVEDRGEVVIIDTINRKLLSRFPLKNCEGPTGIAYDAATQRILSACSDNAVAIVSTPQGKELARLKIGNGADGAAFDAKRNLALVPAGHDGNVTLIRMDPVPSVIGQVATAPSARTIAIDENNGRAYLPAATLAPAVGKERPEAVPGSFRVLVLAP